MNTNLRRFVLILAVQILLGVALATIPAWPRIANSEPAAQGAVKGSVQKWAKVSVELPASRVSFPPGNGSVIANAQCLICHSADMVLRQPPLTQGEWVGEINKMRNAFGAPVPAEQVEALAKYLQSIDGNQSTGAPTAVDAQGS